MIIWEFEVAIEDLAYMRDDLRRHGYLNEYISMAAIVPWETMAQAENLATGPGRGNLKRRLPWTTCLKVFIEVKTFTNHKF